MAWREELRTASFRGVEFRVKTADTDFGRRNEVHEYPNKDVPYTEDFGKKAKRIQIQAYVIGDNFIDDQERLFRAIEDKDTPGTLIHPTRGTLLVVPGQCSHRFSNEEGGIAYFDLEFLEAGANSFPNKSVDTKSAVETSATNVSQSLQNIFERTFTVNKLPEFVRQDAQSVLVQASNDIETSTNKLTANPSQMAELSSNLGTFRSEIPSIVNDPASLAQRVMTLVAQVRGVFSEPGQAFFAYKSMLSFGANLPFIAERTTTRRQQASNQRALVWLYRRSALIGMSNSITDVTFNSYPDAVTARDELAQLLDDELLVIGTTDDDDAFLTIEDLRSQVIKDVTERAANLRRIKIITPVQSMPALVTSYEIYESADYDAEIVQRNRVKHPGFLPANQPLQVLV